MHNTRNEPNVNSELQVIMMGRYRVTGFNKCTTLEGRLIAGEAVHVWGQGAYRKSLYVPFTLAVNLKWL